jgi:hypothetical protein
MDINLVNLDFLEWFVVLVDIGIDYIGCVGRLEVIYSIKTISEILNAIYKEKFGLRIATCTGDIVLVTSSV